MKVVQDGPKIELIEISAAVSFLALALRRFWFGIKLLIEAVRGYLAVKSLFVLFFTEESDMTGQYGIQNTLEVIGLGLLISKGVIASYKDDHKFTFTDALNFVEAGQALPAALSEIGSIPKEMGDFQEDELVQIREYIVSRLPEVGDKWLVVAKESLQIGASVWRVIEAFRKPE